MKQSLTRNFCIIAHIDHGKSTLADRLIELTGALRREEIIEQVMDSMDLERERGITITAKNCSLWWKDVKINIIDTPGHADFGGEVERGLKMADGADLMALTTHKVEFLTGVHNGLPNRPLAEQIVANMREIGAPTYTKEELDFAKKLGETTAHEEKMEGLKKLAQILPSALELEYVDLDTNIYDPFGEEIKGGGGSSDVADVAWNCPTQQFSTAYFIVGAPGHSWQHVAVGGMSIGHKSSIFASKVMAATVLDLLSDKELLVKVKEDWEERMKGNTYKSPLPPDLKPPLNQLEKQPE